MNILRNGLLLLFLGNILFSYAQMNVDSLRSYIKNGKSDTTLVITYNELAWELRQNDPDTAIILSTKALNLANKLNWPKGIGHSFHYLGEFYWRKNNYPSSQMYYTKALAEWDKLEKSGKYSVQAVKKLKSSTYGNFGITYVFKGEYEKGLEYYKKALEMDTDLGNKLGMARHLSNMGAVYMNQGSYSVALEYMFKALQIYHQENAQDQVASTYGQIGTVYYYLSDAEKSLEYYTSALKIEQKQNNKSGMALILGYIGNVHLSQNRNALAKEYYIKAMKTSMEIGDKRLAAAWQSNIGNTYFNENNYDTALLYYFRSMELRKELHAIDDTGDDLSNIGVIYTKLKRYKEAEDYINQSLNIANKLGVPEGRKACYKALSELYLEMGNYQKAYSFQEKYFFVKDSLFNDEKQKEITQKELSYSYDKKEATLKAEQEKKDAISLADSRRKNQMLWLSGLVVLLVLIFSFFLLNRFRITSKQKQLIEKQKLLFEEKNKEILDSINYAKRLQQAVLPDEDDLKKLLQDYFILYKPRDIVSGDFYFIEPIRTNDGQSLTAIAVADCTGHGVPGAFMSMLGYDILKNSLTDKDVNSASQALDYLNGKLTKVLRATYKNQQVRDGMDIAFCVLDNISLKLYFSGANNPCWIIRTDLELIELKPDKQPVGFFENSVPFTMQSVQLQKGDMIVLFTDGYADQFGGPRGKKFMYKQMKELLISNSQQPMNVQCKLLEERFAEWKGNLDQVDDVSIIGIRV